MSNINPNSLARLSMTVDAAAKTLVIGTKAPLKMWLPDPTVAGSYVEKTITAPATINGDGHASENFNTGEVGQTLDRDWLSDYPLTWYLTIESGDIYWVASRNPCMTQMPAAGANIGDFDAAPATSAQGNAFVAASITEADFVDLPVWPIGTMPVTRAAASEIPTLVALTAGKDGPGLWNSNTPWTFPAGQNGCTASYYWNETVGAKNPTYTTPSSITATYTLDSDGSMVYSLSTASAGNCSQAGSPAGNFIKFYTPLAFLGDRNAPVGWGRMNNLTGTIFSLSTGAAAYFTAGHNAAAVINVADNTWGDNAGDDVIFTFRAKAF